MLVSRIVSPLGPNLEIYISNRWEASVLESHQEYIQEIVKDLLSKPTTGIDEILANAKNFSVGPLRLGLSGNCKETDLHEFLSGIFARNGYANLA